LLSPQISPDEDGSILSTRYGSRYLGAPVPKWTLPDDRMPADVAYQIVHDEMALDGNPSLNLATFVTTWMEPQAERLMAESLSKNFVDQDEYPQTTEIQHRCVNMLARLFNAPAGSGATGTSTVGSSEAIHLAGLALKWKWRSRRKSAGLPIDRPNLVMGRNVQVCWEKFARYFDVEPRYVDLTADRYVIGVDEAMALVDEHTIAVVGILGSTYTGEYEPIEALNDALMALNERTGWDVGIHVDGASGAFVAPFVDPDLAWDFRLPLVRSINASGHKYGLVYPGVGWVIWRRAEDLPEDLIFHVNYLGGDEPTFNLNFSKGASQVLAQYYNFLRLGRAGYADIMANLRGIADFLAAEMTGCGHFELLGTGLGLPVVCMRLTGERSYSVFDLSMKLRERGWIVPAYTLAPGADDIAVLRVVVREGLSRDLAESLVSDILAAVRYFDAAGEAAAQAVPHPPPTKAVC
jgi:glutamate decarboxylase